MSDDKAEIAARYRVVELLYRGDIEAAEQSLDSFSKDQTISPGTEEFYRYLLSQARQHQTRSLSVSPFLNQSEATTGERSA